MGIASGKSFGFRQQYCMQKKSENWGESGRN
jgi:hypothetical protein